MTTAAAPAALRPSSPEPTPVRPVATGPALALVPGQERPPITLPRPATVPRLRLLCHEPEPDAPEPAAHAPAALHAPAVRDLRVTVELRRRAHQVLWLVLEVVHGRRTLSHLAPHLEPSALRYVRAATGGPPGRPPYRLASLHVSRPRRDAIEVAAVRRCGGRARAMVARFEGRPEEPARWRCVLVRLL